MILFRNKYLTGYLAMKLNFIIMDASWSNLHIEIKRCLYMSYVMVAASSFLMDVAYNELRREGDDSTDSTPKL